MDWIEILKVIGSTAGVAALITSVFSMISLRAQHRRLLEIEAFKKNTAIESFRHTKIFEALAEIQNFPPINYDLRDMKRVVSETTDRYGKLKAVFTRVSPLLDASCCTEPRKLTDEEEVLSRTLVEHLYTGGAEAPLKGLLLKRQEVEASIVKALSLNLSALTTP